MDLYGLSYVLAIVAALLSIFAQLRVRGIYERFKAVDSASGITGAQAATKLLEAANVTGVAIEESHGTLSDHYDPRTQTLRLSREVFSGRSLSAVGIAAHEAGHAIQHAEGYAPLTARQGFIGLASIGSRFSIPITILGIFLMSSDISSGLGNLLISTGLLLFSVVVLLSVITLPVEFNASSRAIFMLESQDILDETELRHVDKVLSAAAWTYIASTLSAVLTLVRLFLMTRGGRRK